MSTTPFWRRVWRRDAGPSPPPAAPPFPPTQTDNEHFYRPPQQQMSWNQMEPPRVGQYQFALSPAPAYLNSDLSQRPLDSPPLQPAVPEAQVSAEPRRRQRGSLPPISFAATQQEPSTYPSLVNADFASVELPNPAELPPDRYPYVDYGSPKSVSQVAEVPDGIAPHLASSRPGSPAAQELSQAPPTSGLMNVMPPVQNHAFEVPTPNREQFNGYPPPPRPGSATSRSSSVGRMAGGSTHQEHRPRPSQDASTANVNLTKPTCSLNLVCYRSGASGCKLYQVHVAKASRFKDEKAFQAALQADKTLLTTDEQFFGALRDGYEKQMCSLWRRIFFLKTLRALRLLSYTQDSRPAVVQLDFFVLQEILYAYKHPSRIDTEHVWIDWVFQLRQADRRHALEFVEGWNGTRIAVAGMTPLVLSTVVGLVWSVRSGDWQTAFTVAGFILTAGTLLLALLAVISGIEASGKAA